LIFLKERLAWWKKTAFGAVSTPTTPKYTRHTRRVFQETSGSGMRMLPDAAAKRTACGTASRFYPASGLKEAAFSQPSTA